MDACEPPNGVLCLVGAVLALLPAAGFTTSDVGIQWFWTDGPWIAAALIVLASAFTVGRFILRSHRGRTNITDG